MMIYKPTGYNNVLTQTFKPRVFLRLVLLLMVAAVVAQCTPQVLREGMTLII